MDFRDFITAPPTELVKYPDPILRLPALPILEVTEDVSSAAQTMLRLMYQWHGVGLAAPQVGLPYRMFVVNLTGRELVFLNPEVIRRGTRFKSRTEGCLSLPGVSGDVDRPNRILFQAQTLSGKVEKYAYEGLMGCVSQHEIDHLNGVLITDRMSDEDRERVQPVLDRLVSESGREREVGYDLRHGEPYRRK